MISFDWTKRTSQEGQFPAYECSSKYFSSSYDSSGLGMPSMGLKAEGKTIKMNKYAGLFIGSGSNQKSGFKNNIFSFHFRTFQNDQGEDYVDIYIDSKVEFELVIENFENGILFNVDTEAVYERPYTLQAGDYHLQAFQEKTADKQVNSSTSVPFAGAREDPEEMVMEK